MVPFCLYVILSYWFLYWFYWIDWVAFCTCSIDRTLQVLLEQLLSGERRPQQGRASRPESLNADPVLKFCHPYASLHLAERVRRLPVELIEDRSQFVRELQKLHLLVDTFGGVNLFEEEDRDPFMPIGFAFAGHAIPRYLTNWQQIPLMSLFKTVISHDESFLEHEAKDDHLTILEVAARHGRVDIIETIQRIKPEILAIPRTNEHYKMTALQMATTRGFIEAVESLLPRSRTPADYFMWRHHLWSAACDAAQGNRVAILTKILAVLQNFIAPDLLSWLQTKRRASDQMSLWDCAAISGKSGAFEHILDKIGPAPPLQTNSQCQ